MHYQRYNTDELIQALRHAEELHRVTFDHMLADTYWQFQTGLEYEIALMRNELIRRMNPPERIVIAVEVEAA